MSEYHRLFVKGGTYFFTVVTYDRRPLLCEEHALIRLKAAFRYVMYKHPYRMDGLVVLPDHLHCIWRLPENDGNFSVRWNMLKRYFSIGMEHRQSNKITYSAHDALMSGFACIRSPWMPQTIFRPIHAPVSAA